MIDPIEAVNSEVEFYQAYRGELEQQIDLLRKQARKLATTAEDIATNPDTKDLRMLPTLATAAIASFNAANDRVDKRKLVNHTIKVLLMELERERTRALGLSPFS